MKALGPSSSELLMTGCRLVLVLGLVAGGMGCKPKVGEDCAISTDCSISGDRLCDVTQPGGYCTVFNCEPNQCPEEAACVAFNEGTCSAASVSARFRRTFCMRTCEDNSDCRGGSYQCLDVSRDESRQIVDTNRPNQRICAVPSASRTSQPLDPAVCFPSDASFDVSRPEAGPAARDADSDVDAADSSAADRADSNPAESGNDAIVDDVLDSSDVGTNDDATVDAPDAAETTSDDGPAE